MKPPEGLFRLYRAIDAHPWRTVALAAAVLAACSAIASRAHIDDNVAALLPGGPGSPGEAAQLLSEFGALDTLLFDFSLDGATPEALAAQGDALVQRLSATGQFADIYAGPRQDELMKLGAIVLPKRLYLLQDPKATLQAHLAPQALAASLAQLKESLGSPHAIGLKKQLLADPLGLNAGLFANLARQSGKVRLEGGHLLSLDGAHLLLVTTPKHRALDVDASTALMDALTGIAEELKASSGGKAHLRWVGGPRFASESAGLIRKDISVNFILSTAIMLAVFLVRFRGLRLLLLASVPLVFGVVGGVAAMALLKGRLHGMTLGFGSALIGIAMDYPLHLINRAASEPGARAEAYSRTTRAVFQGLCLGFFTTAVGFVALLFSDFPALKELGLFAGVGLVLAFGANFLLVPPLCARLGPRQPTASPVAPHLLRWALPPRAALVATLLLLAGGGLLARRLAFDGDLRKMDSQHPQTLQAHEQVLALFGQPSTSSLVVAQAPSLQEALEVNDAVDRALAPLKAKGQLTDTTSAAGFIPSAATQRARAQRLQALDLASARAALAQAAETAGFAAGAFEPFWAEVEQVASGELGPLLPEELAGTSLGLLLDKAVRCGEKGCRAATALERAKGVPLEALRAVLPSGALLVDSEALAAKTVAEIPRQMALLCVLGILGNVLLLWAIYRSLGQAILTCLPCAIALVLTVGIMALMGEPLNLVSAGGLVLVFGCGVDYGIFSLEGLVEHEPDGVEQLGVLLAAFTTLAGFGTLAIAENGAMRALGISTGLGTAFSAAVALVLLPGLASRWLKKKSAHA